MPEIKKETSKQRNKKLLSYTKKKKKKPQRSKHDKLQNLCNKLISLNCIHNRPKEEESCTCHTKRSQTREFVEQ